MSDPAYIAALHVVMQIEARLAWGRPLCDTSGRRLDDLNQVIDAMRLGTLEPDVGAQTSPCGENLSTERSDL